MLPHGPQAVTLFHTRQLEMSIEKLKLYLFLHNTQEATEQWWSQATEAQMSAE